MSQLPRRRTGRRRRRRRETTDQQPAVRRANGRTWWVYYSSYQLNRTEKTHEQTNFRGRAPRLFGNGDWAMTTSRRVAMILLSSIYSTARRGKTLSRVKCRLQTKDIRWMLSSNKPFWVKRNLIITPPLVRWWTPYQRAGHTETIANEVAGNRSNDKRN